MILYIYYDGQQLYKAITPGYFTQKNDSSKLGPFWTCVQMKVPSQEATRTESDRRILVGLGWIRSDLVGFGQIWSDSVGLGGIQSDSDLYLP